MLTGCILAESLRVGAELHFPALRITRIARADVSASASPTQPTVFTEINFEAPDEYADELAATLAGALAEGPNWYADFRAGDDHVVVFPGRVFRYRVGDPAGREEAVRYGRDQGIPEPQLDWGD
ncbi:hypothetical protein [Paractinoplanes toevensis]|uniref:Uncharacterized protein n=1 Tax=Paractinoplanes toevensis TaxID=571911 RepID=A0A919TF03_9ACTN|nr:hypothetical protein [Actinoplanes toevensis]GIM94335.1 hypothetical protein Ato02nite_061280 [Actinoplanes toevensis]